MSQSYTEEEMWLLWGGLEIYLNARKEVRAMPTENMSADNYKVWLRTLEHFEAIRRETLKRLAEMRKELR